jgi:diacylglycerol kinase (ATP)
MSGIGVITNPRSRANRRNPHLAHRLGYILGERGEVAAPADLGALDETARMFRDREIDILCVNGGDGTLHKAMTAMVRAYGDTPLPPVALLRGGTMNTIARSLGVFGSPAQLLDIIVSAYHDGTPLPTTRRSLLEVDGNYGFLFGTGVMARYLEAYYAGSEPSPRKAAWVLFQAVLSACVGGSFAARLVEPERLDVVADGSHWAPEAYRSVGAGTVADVGLGFRPFFEAPTHPGHLHAIGFATSTFGVVRALPYIWRARLPEDPNIVDQVAREVVIRGQAPVKYMLDGDFFPGSTEVRLRVGPTVEFLCPPIP